MQKILRVIFYLIGLAILSFGVVLNTKTGYGVSPLNSIPYSISIISGYSLGLVTALIYGLYVLIEIVIMQKRFTWIVLLQFPCSIIFGYFTNIFNQAIDYYPSNHLVRIVLLALAIFCTALGVVITIRMNIVPNAPDGLAKEIGISLKKDFGFAKNLLDGISVVLTILISVLFTGHLIGIGVGTFVAVVMIGRTIFMINKVVDRFILHKNSQLQGENV